MQAHTYSENTRNTFVAYKQRKSLVVISLVFWHTALISRIQGALLSSSKNSTIILWIQTSLFSCVVSTRKTEILHSQGHSPCSTDSIWATSGFFSTWFRNTMAASSHETPCFTPEMKKYLGFALYLYI